MSERLRLDVWIDGSPIPAGALTASEDDTVKFAYRSDYIETFPRPISLSLPLQAAAFGDVQTRAFFGNLLPENNQIQRIREREGLEANDAVGILFHLGADCSGAISCLPVGSPPVKVPGDLAEDYVALTDGEIADIMTSLADHQRLPDSALDPSPLAGVQAKIALTVLPDGRWALPRSGVKAPTTHILKVPQRQDASDVKLEAAACNLAQTVGLKTSVPEAIRIAEREGLLITRFDRIVQNGVVYRVHQEDFTQALGLPAGLKYQRKGTPERRFDLAAIAGLLERTAQPALSQEAFILSTFFNLAIGNSDNHAKNYGLLYRREFAPELAPLYDMLPVRMSNRYTHELAFDIGSASFAEKLQPDDFAEFFEMFGMTKAGARRFTADRVEALLQKVEDASAPFPEAGLKAFHDFIGQQLRHLAEVLEISLQIQERDMYAASGGGWAIS